MTNSCVACGQIIPEGRMICPNCERRNVMPIIECRVKLNTTQDVADFVTLCSQCSEDVLVYASRYIVSGKSIMAMYSLDLSKPIKVEFEGSIPESVRKGMKKYIVE